MGDSRARIDLHTHSTCSDGTDSPAELMRLAAEARLDIVALTDHDSTSGWAAAAAAAAALGLGFVRGEEVSCRSEGHSIHLLSYLHDPEAPALREEAEKSRAARRVRAREMVERVGEDYDLTWEEVLGHVQSAGGEGESGGDGEGGVGAGGVGASAGTIGRPHIADALVAKGIVESRDAAFATLMSSRSKYYVPVYATDPVSAVRAVREAGGVPIVAHPGRDGRRIGEHLLDAMVEAGLLGLEIEHRENSAEGKHWLYEYARRNDLIVTGSSDFHGLTGKVNRLGENTTAPEMLQRIVSAATSGLTVL
ncbi:PHP domain-containing protein [Micrococcales bacterium 31B]|nr:PHP domain-containing protein [Micrococcales bacterium 31B]